MRLDPVAVGLLAGYVADRTFGDPHRYHPVAGFGQLAAAVERRTYAPTRARGLVHETLLIGGVYVTARSAERRSGGGARRTLLIAAATWAVLGGRSLEREALAVHTLIETEDLPAARHRVGSLVGRDTTALGPDELARAVVESVAENTADAVVAPLLWGAIAGLPGLCVYRAVNTLDAMIGHRTPRYREFGWAAARVDDAANWLPARLTTVLTYAVAPLLGGHPRDVVRAVREDAPRHPSPNAGPVEAAAAGALGVRLGGVNAYAGAVEDRGQLGDGRPVEVRDIPRAAALSRYVGGAAVILTSAAAAGRSLAPPR